MSPYALGSLLLLGCHSTPPPPPEPIPVTMAERAQEQATKQSEQRKWPSAARAWQLAADRSSLLNDLPRQAAALHNLAQAERELDQFPNASRHLEEAARLNQNVGRTNEWWRNEIALLQVEAQAGQTNELSARFEKLLSALQPAAPSTQGLFLNELGLWRQAQGDFAAAEKAFADAGQRFKAARDSLGIASVQANRAGLAEEQKDFPAALAGWKAALEQFKSLVEPAGIARTLAGWGRTLLAANQDLSTAEDLLRRAAQNYRLLNRPKEAQITLELLVRCLSAEGKENDAQAIRQQMEKNGL